MLYREGTHRVQTHVSTYGIPSVKSVALRSGSHPRHIAVGQMCISIGRIIVISVITYLSYDLSTPKSYQF